MLRFSTIELFKENMKFSAGHFTVFSSTSRENLHGHNYNVYASFTTRVEDEGLSFDYRFYKEKLFKLCQSLDETVLLPSACKYLTITEDPHYFQIHFNDEVMMFLKRDAKILPVQNITVEELSHWFMQQIITDKEELNKNKIESIDIKVFSGPGQSGSTRWQHPKNSVKQMADDYV